MSKYMVFRCDLCDKEVSFQENTVKELSEMIGLTKEDPSIIQFRQVPLLQASTHICVDCFYSIKNMPPIDEPMIVTEGSLTQEEKDKIRKQWYDLHKKV